MSNGAAGSGGLTWVVSQDIVIIVNIHALLHIHTHSHARWARALIISIVCVLTRARTRFICEIHSDTSCIRIHVLHVYSLHNTYYNTRIKQSHLCCEALLWRNLFCVD